ncbi:hypothetical protein H2198_010715 [Neophaeococcomyces mojaviensis]|uniref:Uncharacterized protein n=1 Tax=Neophaeococcomyces mojaviensis TaxID=3383035 RepID=A0ACC2ZQZ7_9EURO|nr:hypothetical protein H2198_010715 [Knufia sp. JES_112]
MTDLKQHIEALSPHQLPAGWKSGWSEQYMETFYINLYTKESTWEKPTEPASSATATIGSSQANSASDYSDKVFVDYSDKIPTRFDTQHDLQVSNELATSMSTSKPARPPWTEESLLSANYTFDVDSPSSSTADKAIAWSRKISCRVMVKRFIKSDESEIAKAAREIAALRALSDPAIPPLLEVLDSADARFLILEDRQDESLKHYIESRGSLSDNMLKAIMTQLFAALAAIFTAGLAHLRLCDETMFIDSNCQLTIKDFHYAHEYGKEKVDQLYATTQAKYGADLYTAPEVFATNTYNARKAVLWSCGVAIYYMTTGQTEKLSNLEHPTNESSQLNSRPSSRRESAVEGQQSRRRSSLGGRKLSLTSPPNMVTYPGTRLEVPSYARDIISKLLITNPLKRAELIEVAAKVPKEIATKATRPLMELAWLDYKTHVGPLAGLGDVPELSSSASSVFSGISNISNPFASLLGGRRRSSARPATYTGLV